MEKPKNRQKSWPAMPDKIAARLLMLSFFLPMQFQVWMLMAVCGYIIYSYFKEKPVVRRKDLLMAAFLGIGYWYYIIAVPLTEPALRGEVLGFCERKLSLMLLPFVCVLLTGNFVKTIRHELIWFAFLCTVSCVLGNVGYGLHYYLQERGAALSHVDYRLYFESITGLHPTYMGMYIVLAIAVILETLNGSPKARIAAYIMLPLLLLSMLALFPKMPVIALTILLLHFAYKNRDERQLKILMGGAVILILLSYLFVPFFSQRINELFRFSSNETAGKVLDNSIYIRSIIWKVDMDMLRQYWLFGTGPGALQNLMNTSFCMYSIALNFPIGFYDPHNEYIMQWLSFGLLGIITWIVVLGTHWRKAFRSGDTLYVYFLLTICLTFVTESVLSTQRGIIFYAFFSAYFFFASSKKTSLVARR